MTFQSGLGFHSMWGFSPSMNFLNIWQGTTTMQQSSTSGKEDPLNILLVKPSDPRHIIHTISRRFRTCTKHMCSNEITCPLVRPIHFYIVESEGEVLARHILLLHIFLDDIPIRHRAALFLEIFGNSLVQGKTEVYIDGIATLLRELIHEGDKYQGYLKNILNFDHLKQKHRDDIDKVFQSWKVENAFDVVTLRDHRLRGYYGDRYDCRKNMIDWDYHVRVKNVASIIHIKQFIEWRMSGIAFEFGDSTYSSPNRSMSSHTKGRVKNGRNSGMIKDFEGIWLDVLVGPYISFGVEIDDFDDNDVKIITTTKKDPEIVEKEGTEIKNSSKPINYAKGLFDVVNKGTGAEQHRHNTVEVAMYNILGHMWELETGQKYQMKIENDIFSGLGEGHADVTKESTLTGSVNQATQKKEDANNTTLLDNNTNNMNMSSSSLSHSIEKDEHDIILPKSKVHNHKDTAKFKSLDGIQITVLLESDLTRLVSKKKYKNLFDHIYLSQHGAHFLGKDYNMKDFLKKRNDTKYEHINAPRSVGKCNRTSSIVSVETGKFFPLDKDEQQEAICSKIVEMGKENGMLPLEHIKMNGNGESQMKHNDVIHFSVV